MVLRLDSPRDQATQPGAPTPELPAFSLTPPLLYRRLGDGGVLFNERTWKTHILTPAAAIIYEALTEQSDGSPMPADQAITFLKGELEVDPTSPEIKQLLAMLRQLRVIV